MNDVLMSVSILVLSASIWLIRGTIVRLDEEQRSTNFKLDRILRELFAAKEPK